MSNYRSLPRDHKIFSWFNIAKLSFHCQKAFGAGSAPDWRQNETRSEATMCLWAHDKDEVVPGDLSRLMRVIYAESCTKDLLQKAHGRWNAVEAISLLPTAAVAPSWERHIFHVFIKSFSLAQNAARCYVVIMKNKHLPGIMLLNGRRRRLLLVTFPNSFAMLARCVVFEPGKRYQEASLSRFVMQHE
jgi:hypothetical protein